MTVYTLFTYIAIAALVITGLRYFISKPRNLFFNYLQNFLGALFLFSGFVKAVDPLGTSYKMHEYFEAFAQEGLRPMWEVMSSLSTPMAVLMIALELVLGVAIIIGWQHRITTALMLWLNLFFLLLTGYTYLSGYCISPAFLVLAGLGVLLLATVPLGKYRSTRWILLAVGLIAIGGLALFTKWNPSLMACAFTENKMKVTDCGCFGDFMKLKPWQTFYKDVLLSCVAVLLVLWREKLSELGSINLRMGSVVAASVVSLVFCCYNFLWSEPVIDFRPYAIGENLVANTTPGRPPVIDMVFVYKNKKTGALGEYTQADFGSMNFDELEFVERKDKVIDEGIPARISNLRIEDEAGQDITASLIGHEGYSLMVVVKNLKETDTRAFTEKLNPLAAAAEKAAVKFYAVCVNDGSVDAFRHQYQCAYPFYHADETPLKTITRSNPGLLMLHNGAVIGKWHSRHLPAWDEVKALMK